MIRDIKAQEGFLIQHFKYQTILLFFTFFYEKKCLFQDNSLCNIKHLKIKKRSFRELLFDQKLIEIYLKFLNLMN